MSSVKRTIIQSESAPTAIGPYSQAVLHAGWLFCSGQIGLGPTDQKLVTGGTAAETRQVLANLRAVLEAAGLAFADVVKTTIYLVDLADFGLVNEIYAEAFGEHAPARATVEVAALPKGARVEIDCIATSRD